MNKLNELDTNEVLEMFNDPEFDRKRAEANVELLQILAQYLTDHPHERFGQALRNLGIIRESSLQEGGVCWLNEFYTEPTDMLERVKNAIGASCSL